MLMVLQYFLDFGILELELNFVFVLLQTFYRRQYVVQNRQDFTGWKAGKG